mgnify:FL=1
MAEETKVEEKVEEKTEATAAPAEETKAEEVKPNPLQRTIELTISRKELDARVAKALREKAKKAKFHGFRPGHAPAAMVRAAYGQEVQFDAINALVSAAFVEKVQEGKFHVSGYPDIAPTEGAPENEDTMSFTATFEVFPDVEVPDMKDASVTEYECELTDADVEKTLDVMRKQRATFEKADKAAAGDRVVVDFKGTLDGVAFEGGTAKDYAFALGQGRMLPEFENAIRGMKAGETKTFNLTFPENYPAKDLAGKEVQFEVTLKEVDEEILPALDDKFAKDLGVTDGIDKLKADVKENLQREVTARLEARTKQSAMNALLSVAKFPVPHAAVEEQREALVHDAIENMKAQGINLPNDSIPANAMLDQAEQRVRLGLQISAIVEKEKITSTDDQIKALADNIAKSYEDPKEVVDWYLNNPQHKAELAAVVVENNVVAWVLKNAQVKKEPISFENLMGRGQQA